MMRSPSATPDWSRANRLERRASPRARRSLTRLLLAVVVCFGAEIPAAAEKRTPGDEGAQTKRPLVLTVDPIFGAGFSPGPGWTELLVGVENGEDERFVGTIESVPPRYASLGVVSARLDVPPHGRVLVHLPVRLPQNSSGPMGVRLLSDSDVELASKTLHGSHGAPPTLVVWAKASRLVAELQGTSLPVVASSGSSSLRVGSVAVEPASGEPILPESPAT